MTPQPETLEPCPFCNARAEFYYHASYGWKKIQCAASDTDNHDEYPDGCGVEPETEWHQTYEDALAAWNTRPIEDALKQRVQELEGVLEKISNSDEGILGNLSRVECQDIAQSALKGETKP